MEPRSYCTLGCVCCARILTNNTPCVCWRPPLTVSVGVQTNPGISYGYSSDSYFDKGTAANSMLNRAVRDVTDLTTNTTIGVEMVQDLFPELRKTPTTTKKIASSIKTRRKNKRQYNKLRDDAEMRGKSVRRLLDERKESKTKNLQPEQEANVHAEDILEMDGDANRIDHSPITVAAEVHHPTIVIAEVHHPSADDDWDSGDDDIALIHFCP